MKYFIKETENLKESWFTNAVQTPESVRYSLDGTQCILKYPGKVPVGFHDDMTQEEILLYINNPENGFITLDII